MSRDLDWPGCLNIRDLGGLPTEDGRTTAFGAVLRADNVRRLTEEGWARALGYGVRTVLDLRSAGERGDDGPAPSELDVITVSLFDDFDSDDRYRADLGVRLKGKEVPTQYRMLYSEALRRNAREFALAVEAIAAAQPGGVIVHCVGGKDRTGVLVALLLRLARVPLPAVVADYERSEERLGVFDSAPREVIGQVLKDVELRYGGVTGYLLNAGASNPTLSNVRRRLLGRGTPPRRERGSALLGS
jgi:protein-tyrosine phosphatase